MEGVKTYLDEAQDLEEKKIMEVRELLRQAADVKDPRDMWFCVRDIFNLLTLLIVPPEKIEVVTPESLDLSLAHVAGTFPEG